MNWSALIILIRDEAGPEIARRIEARAIREMAGVRITVGARAPVDPEVIEAIAPGQPRKAAQMLGISPSTAYRALRRPIVR